MMHKDMDQMPHIINFDNGQQKRQQKGESLTLHLECLAESQNRDLMGIGGAIILSSIGSSMRVHELYQQLSRGIH
jgi:hypothetical protein